MKPVLDEFEQLKSPPKKPQTKQTTSGLKEINPVNLVAEAIKQSLGPVLDKEELAKRKEEESQKVGAEIAKKREELGNISVIKPPKTPQARPPAYITGKPGYHPEQDNKKEEVSRSQIPLRGTQKQKIPELVVPTSKPRRGDLYGVNRKKTSIENKSGYQG